MNRLSAILVLSLLFFCSLSSHEGHHESSALLSSAAFENGSWMRSTGNLHLFLLHFPIALIVMTAIAEILFAFSKKPLYGYAARFMLLSAAILIIPTMICGYLLRYSTNYQEPLATYIWWHMISGTASAFFASYVAYLRESKGVSKLYYISLTFLFFTTMLTGLFGSWVAF